MSKSWWIGGWGPDMGGDARGISRMRSRPDGSLELVSLAVGTPSPSMLATDGNRILAVAEGRGTVEVFALTGDGLELTSSSPTGGQSPCSVARWGDLVVAANFADGSIGVIVDGELSQVLEGTGSGPAEGQAGPHAHAVVVVDESVMLSADLGADRIHIHARAGSRVERTSSVAVPAGTGPRDIAQHPSGAVYVLGELASEIVVFDRQGATLTPVSSAGLPGSVPGDHAAGLAVGSDGRFVYTGLRGSNRIAVLAASTDGRFLVPVGSVPCAGDWPRHLVVDGDLLHVANQLSADIATFRLGADGMPVLIAPPTPVPTPTYLVAVGQTRLRANRTSRVKWNSAPPSWPFHG